jgi:adenine-specific DNA-methyltransferase
MIYIDPPYNTGSDGFVYEDDRKFTVRELQNLIGVDTEKAKRILSFTQQKSNSHSAWLTFMYPRLYIAKQLLKDDGIIFISIDDNEVAQLRLLMDEVFGEENFIANIVWHKKYGASNDSKYLSEVHDHILLYAKSKEKWVPNLFERPDELNAKYKNADNDERGEWIATNLSVKTYSEANDYIIVGPNGDEFTPPPTRAWVVSEKKYFELLKDNRITFGKDNKSRPYLKTFLSEVQDGIVPTTIWNYNDAGHNIGAKSELRDLFSDSTVPFDTPKPTKLIKRIISVSQKEKNTDLIFDFFAGSGTTGDAVMQLNAEDGGKRKFVLVQIPEPINPKKNKAAYDFVKDQLKAEPTIFEITKERLVRAAKKINERLDEKTTNLQLRITKLKSELQTEETKQEIENLTAEITQNAKLKTQNAFKIFETTPIWEDYDFEAEQFDSTQTLFDIGKLSEDDIKALLTTWKTYDGIALTQELEKIDLSGYLAYYGNSKLYLMDKGFTTENLKTLLEKIDSEKKFNPTSIIAFGYHLESKNLRELSENVKSYANKKNIDIDFITRY